MEGVTHDNQVCLWQSHNSFFNMCMHCDSNNFSINVAYIQTTRQLSIKLTLSSFSSALVEEATTEGKPDGLLLGVSDIGCNSANGDLAGDVCILRGMVCWHFGSRLFLSSWTVSFQFPTISGKSILKNHNL